MNDLLIRITDHEGLNFDNLIGYLSSSSMVCFGVQEEPRGENKHYHFWLRSKLSLSSHRKKIKAIVNSKKGERDYSMKDDIKPQLHYLCKGPKAISKLKDPDYPGERVDPMVVINTMNISDEDIVLNHNKWWNDAVTFSEVKSTVKNKDKESWFSQLLDACKLCDPNDGWNICKCVIDYYRVHCKCEPNDFQIKCYCKSIQRELVYRKYPDRYQKYLYDRAQNIIGSEWVSV